MYKSNILAILPHVNKYYWSDGSMKTSGRRILLMSHSALIENFQSGWILFVSFTRIFSVKIFP